MLGRFLQTDPIGYGDNMNMYAYVANDPINAKDPTGEFGIVGAIINVAIDLAISAALEEKISGEQILVSAALGASGAGLISKLSKVAKLGTVGTNTARVVNEGVAAAGGAIAGNSEGIDAATDAAAVVNGAVVSATGETLVESKLGGKITDTAQNMVRGGRKSVCC